MSRSHSGASGCESNAPVRLLLAFFMVRSTLLHLLRFPKTRQNTNLWQTLCFGVCFAVFGYVSEGLVKIRLRPDLGHVLKQR